MAAMRSVDNCIIEKKIGIDYMHVAQELRLEITGADRTRWIPPEINITSVVSWANQSFAIATRPDVQYCVQKDDDACWYADDQKQYRGGAQRVVTVDDAYLAAQAATVREQ